ncbi:MAG: type II secretion system protein [Methylophilaceae bacterium]|nr:type II secretion system protein [Methylophilaceae bacterium]
MPNQYINKSQGFTYIGLLIVIAIAGIGLATVGMLWQTEMQREREKELLFVGNAFKQALISYQASRPSGNRQLPRNLQDLVTDPRFPNIKHHLRKVYRDPMTGKADWGLELQQGAIIGIYSQSKLQPIKKFGFDAGNDAFVSAKKYSDWKFTANPG